VNPAAGFAKEPDREMANSEMNFGMDGIVSRRKPHFARVMRFALVLVVSLCFWSAASAWAGDAEVAETPRPNRTNYASFQSVLREQMHLGSELPRETQEQPKVRNWQSVLVAVEFVVCMLLIFRLLVPRLGKLLDSRLNPVAAALAQARAALHEEKAVADFANVLQMTPKGEIEVAEQRKAMLDEFYQAVPKQLKVLLSRFVEIGKSAEPTARQQTLDDLKTEITALKNRAGSLELTPAWHLASALEKLIEQLTEKPANVTPSTLRTAAGGLLVLKDLCVPNVRKDLATNPPIRFLAVDDDPISRRAVSMSLKRVAQAPDLAEHGEAALQLAERQVYDAVFLDVEMPGLDGFEVCTRIRQLPGNRLTPVVFVTSHSDFESRAKSTSSGGRDLIAKPFLSAEITVKALTLLFRGRLDRQTAGAEALAKETSAAVATTPVPSAKQEEKKIAAVESKNGASKLQAEANAPAASNADTPQPPEQKSPEPLAPNPQEYAKAFAVHGAEHLREMEGQIIALHDAKSAAARQEIFGEIYLGLNVVRSEAARAGLKTICELASALGKLISKLLDKPKLYTPSTLQATTAAIGLLEELARGGVEVDAAHPPVRVLVVDDEPLSRRAITNALQLAFGKPDSAENGESAVVLAQNKVFDVIFLDILMPEMDGFETCSKIRETRLNGTTPIIFVTSQTDNESRGKSIESGGNGFISKPVLPAEIFLTALTFALRARMGKGASALPAEQLEAALC
jgi:CheY-like chemotaxis protein/F0F1-type ATP synthase membrane subunit b/b'